MSPQDCLAADDEYAELWRSPTEWNAGIDSLASSLGFDSPEDLRAIRLNVRDWLAQATFAVLSVEVVADVADPALILGGRGPWLAAVNPGRALPGPEWSAGPRVVRAVRHQLRPLSAEHWSEITGARSRVRDQGGEDNAYNDLCWRLYCTYSTSAAGIPWSKLADLPAGREFKHVLFLAKDCQRWWSGRAALLPCSPIALASQRET